jgi:nuclear receptor interaction protein
LASGSDDTHLNIYSYQPESSDAPFALSTTVLTGHRANIFSVKFMPHSNDGTLITCAGDSQVRVFDIEYSSGSRNDDATTAFAASTRNRRFNEFFTGARYLSDGNTNARIYKSHADRVKRIVTESSPFLFLTCSEDGEVRQWDLRLPSSAYPSPRGGQGFMAHRPGLDHDDSNVPPPLISYKPYSLDLNTISCSPSQPHYIALGGAHLHCFLHDRRMLGRDTSAASGSASPSASSLDDEHMSKATRCVRRFAPGGKNRMKHVADGHITACKISDANPDEIVVSWSGNHIYSFDLIRSPDARETQTDNNSTLKGKKGQARRGSRSRKRKRQKPATPSSQESTARHHSRRRSEEPDTFRIEYENGESEEIQFPTFSDSVLDGPDRILEEARYSVLTDAQRLSMDIAKALVNLRRTMFSLERTAREAAGSDDVGSESYSGCFSSALELCSTYLPKMDEVMGQWSYPMNPSQETVTFQQSLRRNRQSAWRFVQAAGTLARALANQTPDPEETSFLMIKPAPGEEDPLEPEALFGYEFLRAILLWLQGGRQSLLEGFQRRNAPRRLHSRYPIPDESDEDAIETILVPYIMEMARDTPIVNVDANRFEHDNMRILFQTQRAAVTAFGNAVRLPLEDLGDSAARFDRRRVSNPSSQVRSLDRASAKRFWILRVGRGILMEAGSGVNYSFVNHAFGGLHAIMDESDSGMEEAREQADIDPSVEEERTEHVGMIRAGSSASRQDDSQPEGFQGDGTSSDNNDPDTLEDDSEDNEAEDSTDDEDDPLDDLSSSSDEDTEESDSDEILPRRYAIRKARHTNIERNVPCIPHMRSYRGHCNVKTVKDVNYFGLNDEYVVSGSDSGHIFIWERKTSNLVNILEGDSEVVNVVQGKFCFTG